MLLIKIHICPPQLSHCHLLVVNVVLDQRKVGSLCSVGCSTSTALYIKYVYINNYSINPNQNNLRSITIASFMHPAPLQPPEKKMSITSWNAAHHSGNKSNLPTFSDDNTADLIVLQ